MKRIRKAQATLNLPTLKLEGGLFLPDQLEKAAQGRASAQSEADYGTPKGVKLKDEYSRAFQIACAQWQHFTARMERADLDAAQLTTAFVHELLRDAFGYATLQTAPAQPVGELRYPVSLMAGHLPVLVAPHALGLDEADARFAVQGGGNRRKAPFQAMQELLNASAPLQWGIVSNGRQLRLLRDAASLTRPSFLEVDLADLLGGQRYAEFANVWRLLHASRSPIAPSPRQRGEGWGEGQSAANCIWERWRNEGQQEGTRVRDGLRDGVEQALLTFGAGFLQHPANHALRAALNDGTLSKDEYFQQLLRLVYRLIFVFTVEERGVLHPRSDSADAQAARRAYAEGYALIRLRELCLKRRARTRHDDQWQAIRIVFRGLAQGEPRLALPALGGLFAPAQCPDLDAASLDNAHLLAALQHLRWAKPTGAQSLVPVDYRNMGPEELGSVYESLLELVPAIDLPARTFGFVGRTEEGSTAGNARKLTGSYYTPDSLVQELIKSALDPVIEQRLSEAGRMANSDWEALSPAFREIFKRHAYSKLSGTRHLATRPSSGDRGLSGHQHLSANGTARLDVTNMAGIGLDPEQHRRGLGEALPSGIHPVLADSQRQPGGTGNPTDDFDRPRIHEPTNARPTAGIHDDSRQADTVLRAQPQAHDQLKALWQATPSAIRHSQFAIHALLSIRVIDPACGSGHFLLAAARRLAEKLAQLRSLEGGQEGAIQPQDYRHALREVVARCIYGVDRNPMAIELARMALWLEGYEEGRPLGFLDHHLQVGDALLGLTDLNVLEQGIAKDAFKPLSGDDKDVCKELAKANAAGLKQIAKDLQGKQMLLGVDNRSGMEALRAIETLPADTPEQVAAKEQAWRHFLEESTQSPLAHAADALVGAYLLPKVANGDGRTANGEADNHSPLTIRHSLPTSITLHALLTAPERAQTEHAASIAAARDACEQARAFHWPLAFPQVFAQGGFDCVLGNPPWERIKLQEEEFFATRHRDVAEARNKAERAQRIQWLSEGMLARHLYPDLAHEAHEDEAEKRLYREFVTARRTAEAASVFAHVKGADGGRYPLTGVGDVNTYALFAETILQIHADSGRAGFIVPTGIATDDSTKAYFGHITQNRRLVSLYDIENRDKLFAAVDSRMKFCLLTLGAAEQAEFVCFATQVSQLADPRRRFTLTPDEFRLINPNTLTCPVFRSERDAELTKKLYRAAPVLMRDAVTAGEGKQAKVVEPAQNPWGISFMTMFHMSNDSHLFKDEPAAEHLPLYEAKLIHQFDHRWATYTADGNSRDVTLPEKADPDFTVTPRYWVSRTEVEERLCKRDRDGRVIWQWERDWLMGWRGIARATDERSVIGTVMPLAGVGNSWHLVMPFEEISARQVSTLVANISGLVFDFVARQKIGGANFNFYIPKQLPIFSPEGYSEFDFDFIVPRVLGLTYTAHDLSGWAQDLGYDGEPFPFDPDRRATLRAELDAYYAKLYGLTRDELRYILDPADVMGADYPSETFRVLKNKELKEFGEYRTQRLVLEAWDVLQQQQPITVPTVKPSRRTVPLPVYAEGGTPASEAEDWLAGLVCDVLLQAGPCDDNRLRRILGARLPEDTPHVERLHDWLGPVNTERWPHICGWLRDLLGVATTASLSIRNPEALAEIIGDYRTESLARALIEARRHHEATLAEVMADSASDAQTDELRKRG